MQDLQRLINRIKSSEYIKSLLTLTGGTFFAQLIPIIFYPIVCRLYSPDVIGSAAVFSQISAILAIVITGGYNYAIFIAESKKEAFNLLTLVYSLSIVNLVIVFILFWVFRVDIGIFLNAPLFEELYYIPLLVALFIIIYQGYNEWCVKNKYFGQLSVNKLINTTSISVSESSIGFFNSLFLGNGKIWGELLGRGISAFCCLFSIFQKDKKCYTLISKSIILQSIKKYAEFPKYMMTGKLLNSISCAVPIFYMGIAFSKEQLGYFSMANIVIAIPVSVITLAVSDAFRQRADEDYKNEGSCKNILIKTLKPIALISIIGFSSLYILAPSLFEFVLGSQWIESGIYVRYLVPMVAISFVTEIVRPVLVIADKKLYDFIWQVLFLISMFIIIAISEIFGSVKVYLVLFSVVKSVLFLLQFYWCYKYSDRKC